MSIAAEKSIYLQEKDLHLEKGDQISTEADIDDGWQGVCVFLCLRACACVYLCFWWPEGWLSREITPLLGNTGGIGGRFSFLRGSQICS